MTAVQPQARRREYLNTVADEALSQVDADDARRAAIEAAQEEAEQQRRDNIAKRDAARAAWLESVGEMQEHAQAFVAALERGLEAAAEERATGVGVVGASDVARMTRISRYLSGQLRGLLGPTAPRFGELALTSFPPRPIANWTDQESKQ